MTEDPAAGSRDWWRNAVVYQIYPRSFADSDGDGLGDLPGIVSRIPYLAELGVDAVWLSPFYPSALADGGYDVDDHRAVDPRLGTLADFDRLVAGLHSQGLKLVVDIVPNHTSDRHRWFQGALASEPGSPARARYVFMDGVDEHTPPTDWTSYFGGPAWQQVADGQWYLHLFAREQPDLNWNNPEVRADLLATLRFWADRGVDGFRVDVAHHLFKDLTAPLPSQKVLDSGTLDHTTHPYNDRDEVQDIYADWRALFEEYDPPRAAVAEAWVEPKRRSRYATRESLGQAFNFDLLRANWDVDEFRAVIREGLDVAAETRSTSTWVLSNHDVVRHASRYGLPAAVLGKSQFGVDWLLSGGTEPPLDVAKGDRRARAAALLMLALPGAAYVYQGEELGLHEVADLPDDVRQDPTFARTQGREKGRDGCRVPLPWKRTGVSLGFGDAEPHLPQPDWFAERSVEAEDGDAASMLNLYRRAIALRRSLSTGEHLDFAPFADPGVLHLVRSDTWHCVVNFGARAVQLPPGEVLLTSIPLADGLLPPDAAAWINPGERADSLTQQAQ